MTRRYSRVIATIALVCSVLIGQASASFAGMYDHVQRQSEVTLANTTSNGSGTWGNTTLNRPVVTSLTIDGVPQSADGDAASGSFGVTVAPTNVCRTDQTPSAGYCYSTPNRVAVSVYYNDAGDAQADLSAHGLTSESVIELEIALNDAGPLLGWSYATGNPKHWSITNPGTTSAVLSVALEPREVPAINWQLHPGAQGCSRIPVQGCDLTISDAADTLQANLLLSLDTTLDEVFRGTLFAGDDTVIGSFESGPVGTPSFTYGVASAHNEFSGEQRTGVLSAVISDAMLTSYFGLDSSAMTPEAISTALPIVRTTDRTDALPTTVVWTRWTSGTEGTDGWLVTISGISFSAPKYKVAQAKTRPSGSAKLKASGKVNVAVEISGSAKTACNKKKTTCTVNVYKVVGANLTTLGDQIRVRSNKSALVVSAANATSAGLSKGSKIAVQVWATKSGVKTLVSSSIFKVK